MKRKKIKIEKIHSGIPGLDKIFKGGLIKGSISLLAGYSGVGKTVFGLQFLKEGLEAGDTCVFVSLKTSIEERLDLYDIIKIDWDTYKEKKKLFFLYLKADKIRKLKSLFKKLFKKNNNCRLVIDDFPASFDLKNRNQLTMDIESIIDIVRQHKVTSVFTNGVYDAKEYHGLAKSVLPPLVDNIMVFKEISAGFETVTCFSFIKAVGNTEYKTLRKTIIEKNGIHIKEEFKVSNKIEIRSNKIAKIEFIAPYKHMEKETNEYNKINKDIQIILKTEYSRLGYSYIVDSVKEKSATAGLAILRYSQLIKLAKEDVLLNLDQTIERQEYFGKAIDACTIDNTLFGVPESVSCRCLIYRKDLLEKYGMKVPSTWDELIDEARYILKKEKNTNLSGVLLPLGPRTSLAGFFIELLWGHGGDIHDEAGNVAIADRKAVSALRLLERIIKDKLVRPDYYMSDNKKYYSNGRAIFYISVPEVFKEISDENCEIIDKTWLAPMPGVADKRAYKILMGFAYLIPGNTKYPEESIKYLKYLISRSKENEIKAGYPFSAQKSVLFNEKVRKMHLFYGESEKILENCRVPDLEIKNFDYILTLIGNKVMQVIEKKFDSHSALAALAGEIKAGESRKKHGSIIERVVEYLQKNYDKKVALQDIADTVRLSPNYLCKIFEHETRHNIFEYLRQIRIAKAKELIKDPRYNISEVASKVGFTDLSSFGKFFRREELISPGEYRAKR